jgi:8-oxo-dGTP pyrophosphatase MutT (NUDIX family)
MEPSHISELLGGFSSGDVLLCEYQARMLKLVQEHPHDFWKRAHFIPGHITASAWVIHPERTHALLIFHKGAGAWFQPGGHIEATDTSIFNAVLREVKEETGLDGVLVSSDIFDIDIHPIAPRPEKSEPAHTHFDMRFLVEVPHQLKEITDGGIGGIKWLTLVDIEKGESALSVLRMARQSLR